MTEEQKVSKTPVLLVGVDIGSTTTKLAVMTEDTKEMLYTSYRRHNSNQIKSVREAFQNLAEKFPDARLRIAVTGSGARPVSKGLHVPFIQEVVANNLSFGRNIQTYGQRLSWAARMRRLFFSGKVRERMNFRYQICA